MLGSKLDLFLRQIEPLEVLHFGTFIINGNYTLLNPFSANNLTAGYIYASKTEYCYKMNIQHAGTYYKITYTPQNSVSIEISHDVEMEHASLIRGWKRKATDEHVTDEPLAALEVLDVLEYNSKPKNKRRKLLRDNDYREPNQQSIDWVKLLNIAGPTSRNHPPVTKEEYEHFFQAVLDHAPQLDDLANKTVIWPVLTFDRALKKFLSTCTSLSSFRSKFLHAVLSGNMFVSYTSKNKVEQNRTNVNNAQKSVYEAIETNKYNTMALGIGSVKRNISSQVKNSKALHFPRDGRGFICPITTKELKGAGEIVHYTLLTINSVAIGVEEMQTFFERNHNPMGAFFVVWDGFLTKYRVDAKDTKSLILKIKSSQPLLVIHIYGKYVNFLTQGAIPVHYSVQYRFFFSCFELKCLPDALESNHHLMNFSPYVFNLHEYTHKALIPKLGVAVQNLKGSCVEFTSKRLVYAFMHNVGYNSGLLHRSIKSLPNIQINLFQHSTCTPQTIPIVNDPALVRYYYLQLAEDEVSAEEKQDLTYTQTIHKLRELISLRNQETRQEADGYKYSDIIPDANYHFANIQAQIDQYMKPYKGLEVKNKSETTKPEMKGVKQQNRVRICQDTVGTLPDNVPSLKLCPEQNFRCHLMLYCAFGDIEGATTEDGIILDKTLCDKGFEKLGAIQLKILWKKLPSDDDIRLHHYIFYRGSNTYSHESKEVLFGILESSLELVPMKSKNINIDHIIVNGIHQYTISCKNIIAPVSAVESEFKEQDMLLMVHYRYIKKLGVGTKIANLHGQKGICSKIVNLRETGMFGYNLAGQKVYPQVLFNISSLIGRLVTSQICSQLNSPKLALGPNGLIIAPLGIIIHHREPPILANQVKKCDIMTAENGFIGTENGTTLNILKKQNLLNNINTNLTVLELATTMGTKINFLSYGCTL